MPCNDLKMLREQAIALNARLKEHREKRRASELADRRVAVRGTSDLTQYLQRKLQRTSEMIEQHILDHKCQ